MWMDILEKLFTGVGAIATFSFAGVWVYLLAYAQCKRMGWTPWEEDFPGSVRMVLDAIPLDKATLTSLRKKRPLTADQARVMVQRYTDAFAVALPLHMNTIPQLPEVVTHEPMDLRHEEDKGDDRDETSVGEGVR